MKFSNEHVVEVQSLWITTVTRYTVGLMLMNKIVFWNKDICPLVPCDSNGLCLYYYQLFVNKLGHTSILQGNKWEMINFPCSTSYVVIKAIFLTEIKRDSFIHHFVYEIIYNTYKYLLPWNMHQPTRCRFRESYV